MPTLEILIGLSGSGKSTYAENTGYAVVSRDSLRKAMFGSDHQDYYERPDLRAREDAITVAEHAAIAGSLSAGLNVVHDATNLTPRFSQKIANIGYANGATVKVKVFDVPLQTALDRNRKRGLMGGRLVPEDVVRKQHQRFQTAKNWKPKQPPSWIPADLTNDDRTYAIMVDIDGTLAHMHNRGPFDWDKVKEDKVDEYVWEIVNNYSDLGYEIIILSGRDGVSYHDTRDWLLENDVPVDRLIMRAAGDMRPDDIVKHELFHEDINDKYIIRAVIDDRPKVCRMWRAIGLPVFQVGDPHKEF